MKNALCILSLICLFALLPALFYGLTLAVMVGNLIVLPAPAIALLSIAVVCIKKVETMD